MFRHLLATSIKFCAYVAVMGIAALILAVILLELPESISGLLADGLGIGAWIVLSIFLIASVMRLILIFVAVTIALVRKHCFSADRSHDQAN